ncbi:MAG: sigma-70 family RNA polymerase sigma factor [Clostridia bacterium]|nr:sigma-70 family RNA polymerase sigma factor [Clostridia bacterium]
MNGYKNTIDKDLVKMTLVGDEKAYEELVTRHERSVHGTAFKITKNRYSAEDASQDAFVAAWTKLDTLKEGEKFGSWICAIARNCALRIASHYRCAAADISFDAVQFALYEEGEGGETASLPDLAFLNESDRYETLRDAVEALTEKLRETVKLHYFEELSVAEIAEKLSLPVGTVKWRLSEGRKQLRKEYGIMDKEYNENETIVERVMRQVEALKLLAKQTDKTEFKKEYKKVLANVESLRDSKEKSHALADVLMHGVWWTDGEKSEELFERIKAEAMAGHNDEVMQSVVSREAGKYHGKERVDYMINTQVPFLEENNLPLSLGFTWFWAGWSYSCENETENAIKCFDKVLDVLKPTDVYYANALSAKKCEKFRETHRNKQRKQYGGGATGEIYKLINGRLMFWSQPGYSFGNTHNGESIFWNASRCDCIVYDENMQPGDTYVCSDKKSTLEYRENGITVETKAGVFENCSLWIFKGDRYGLTYCETYICPGVGIVKQRSERYEEDNVWELTAYTVKGGSGLIPFEKGNRWEYAPLPTDGPVIAADSYFEVISCESNTFVVTAGHTSQLLGLGHPTTWEGAMSCFTQGHYVNDEHFKPKMIDVEEYVCLAEKYAQTKREKVITAVSADVMRRIQRCYPPINPDYTEKGKWNFFSTQAVNQKPDGTLCVNSSKKFSNYGFTWKGNMWNIGTEGYKVLYGNFLLEIQQAIGCVWSDEWIPGYKKTSPSRAQKGAEYTLEVLDDETVVTPCGTFENCRHVTYELKGMDKHGAQFQGGKKDIWYAQGIGIVKFQTDYWYDRTLSCFWELKAYKGTGEGYFPVIDGAYRKYAPDTIGDGWNASVEHTYDTDESGTIILHNVLGTRNRAEYEADDNCNDSEYD